MPKTLERTRKQIAKKRHGAIDALHEFSRDSKRLHKAQVRDDRLEKLIAARKKHDKPLIARVTYFQKVAQENENRPLDLEKIQNAINQFVRQDDEEYSAIKKARRPGRGPSAREDMLKMKIQALEKEQKNGFYMPDLSTQENINALSNWEGSWGGLASLILDSFNQHWRSQALRIPAQCSVTLSHRFLIALLATLLNDTRL